MSSNISSICAVKFPQTGAFKPGLAAAVLGFLSATAVIFSSLFLSTSSLPRACFHSHVAIMQSEEDAAAAVAFTPTATVVVFFVFYRLEDGLSWWTADVSLWPAS